MIAIRRSLSRWSRFQITGGTKACIDLHCSHQLRAEPWLPQSFTSTGEIRHIKGVEISCIKPTHGVTDMPKCKAIRCFNCDSVVLANTLHVAPHPSGNDRLQTLRCPACSAITLRVSTSELKPYTVPRAARERGYAKKGEWHEIRAR